MKIGIVGCGTIGTEVALAISKGDLPDLTLCGISDVDGRAAENLSRCLRIPIPILSLDELIENAELVFESTSAKVMPDIVEKSIASGTPVVAMSVGGLVFRPHLLKLVETKKVPIYFPSGALAGIDALLAAKEAGVNKVQLSTTKHPKSLDGAPYLIKNGISLERLDKAKVVFEGNAREAIEGFPANANVAITLSIAGIGIDQTKVVITADPHCKRTKQEIIAEGDFGIINCVTEGITSPQNPRTGYFAILSAFATLRRIASTMRVGT